MITIPPRSPLMNFLLTKPAKALAWTSVLLAIALIAWINLFPFSNKIAGISYVLPLFLCLWTRNRFLLYLTVVVGAALVWYKLFVVFPAGTQDAPVDKWQLWIFQVINILLPALLIHLADYVLDRLDLKRRLLTQANQELSATNLEVSRRQEEVTQQNQELQAQAEELERQAEELRQQAEELEQQTVELHAANDELTRRERGLQTLLESARWLRADLLESDVMSAVCQAAVQVMEEGVTAAAIVCEKGGTLSLRGYYGFGMHGTLREAVPWERTFSRLVMERNQTAYIADLESRPDILIPQPAAGKLFRSILATPLTIDGRVIGAVEVYAPFPREWTDGEFKVIEWLAAQCALALQAIEYQQEVIVKRREAEEASIQKTRFLAAVSHDVRTPANAISLIADLIVQAASRGEGVADLPVLAHDLKSNARTLVELVSDVLDLTRLDTGKSDLQMSEFRLGTLVESTLRQFEHVASEKKLRLTCQLHSPDPCLRTDKTKLSRVLANLVGNAIKFTQTGGVEVRTRLTPDGSLALSVVDTGMGIPRDALPRIFDEFFQLQNPERDRNKGSGLGLAICKRLVDVLGARMSVESTMGVGTTFTVALPRDFIVPERPASPVPHDGVHSSDGKKLDAIVLLVEDHDVTRRATSRLLSSRGARVLEARNAREALQILTREQPEVLLLDLMLPDADGTDILRHLQTQRPASLRRILAVSGDVRDARIHEVKELGADDLVAKPLDIHKLMEAIER